MQDAAKTGANANIDLDVDSIIERLLEVSSSALALPCMHAVLICQSRCAVAGLESR